MDLIKKSIEVVAKAADDGRRIVSFVGSTGDRDRDDEVIKPSGWDVARYKQNPVFLWGHNHSNPPIGKTVSIKKDRESGTLNFDVEFPTEDIYPFADTIFKLYKSGYLNAVSVGFMPLEYKEGDPEKGEPRRTYTRTELLELSGVTVPSNYNALVSARAAGAIDDGEFVCMKAFMEGGDVSTVKIIKPQDAPKASGNAPEEKAPAANLLDDTMPAEDDAPVVKVVEGAAAETEKEAEGQGAPDVIEVLATLKRLEDGVQLIAKMLGIQSIMKDDLCDAVQTGDKQATVDAPESSASYFDMLFSETKNLKDKIDNDSVRGLMDKAREIKEK